MGWSLDKPIHEWVDVRVKQGRITNLSIYIDDEGVKGLILPSGLQTLELISKDICDLDMKGFVLPPGLQTLFLLRINIDYESAIELCNVLPSGLQTLSIHNNNISEESAKGLVLPPGLKNYTFTVTKSVMRV